MKITIEITSQKIADLMVSCMESSYAAQWVGKVEHLAGTLPEGKISWKRPYYSDPDLYDNMGFVIQFEHDGPNSDEGENDIKTGLTHCGMKRGLEIMAQKSPYQFGMLLSDDADAITADVFLQCCLLGDIVFA